MNNEEIGDCKCWLCGCVKKPSKIYGPNICMDCMPGYRERNYTWKRWTTEDIAELFPECRSILETGGN